MKTRIRRYRHDPYAKYRRGEFYYLSGSKEPYTRQQFIPLIKKLLNPPQQIAPPPQECVSVVSTVPAPVMKSRPVMKMNLAGNEIEVTGSIDELAAVFVHMARIGA